MSKQIQGPNNLNFFLQILLLICIFAPLYHAYFLQSYLQICDSNRLRNYRRNFCPTKLVFTLNSTKINSDCICVGGVWLIINRDCIASITVSKGGCILSPHIKAMQYLGSFGRNDFFTVISKSENDISYSLIRPVYNTWVNGPVWIYNGKISMSNDGSYCIGKRLKLASHLKIMTSYVVNGRVTIQEECSSIYSIPVNPQLEYALITANTSECKVDCTKSPSSRLTQKKPDYNNNNVIISRGTKGKPGIWYKTENKKNLSIPSKRRLWVPKRVKNLYELLHKRFAQRVLHLEYPNTKIEPRADYIPVASFQILEILQKIVYKVCSNRVSLKFLEFAHMLFRTVYERRGTELMESLDGTEANKIMHMLDHCYTFLKPLEFVDGLNSCKNEDANRLKTNKAVVVTVSTHTNRDFDLYLTSRHLTLEIPWNMVDLTVGICIDSFAESYILYHKMEQALEKLFTKDLMILWKYPPEDSTFYTRLYGPHWRYYAENLEKCVESVYIQNPKLSRLRRPDETSGHDRRFAFEKRTPIPGITPSKFQSTPNDVREKASAIIASANLTCQSFNLRQCHGHTRVV